MIPASSLAGRLHPLLPWMRKTMMIMMKPQTWWKQMMKMMRRTSQTSSHQRPHPLIPRPLGSLNLERPRNGEPQCTYHLVEQHYLRSPILVARRAASRMISLFATLSLIKLLPPNKPKAGPSMEQKCHPLEK